MKRFPLRELCSRFCLVSLPCCLRPRANSLRLSKLYLYQHITNMNGGIQVCNTCNTSLAIGLKLHFCPYCGTVQLEKKVLASKTTQNYDPSNPQHKPWRDNPHLPKRNYTYGNSKKKQPWCPPMRQLRVRNRVGKSKNLLTGVGIDENLNFNSVDLHKVNQAVDNTDGDSYEGNVGEEHASQQAEKEAKSAPESFTECM